MHELDTHKKIAVIADDLTGANDTGVQFAKQGLKTIVLMGRDFPSGSSDDDVVVMDSQSRSLTPGEAYRKVAALAVQVREGGFCTVFKKIDSTLRGNVAPKSTPSWIPAARISPSWSRPFRRTAEPPWAGISSCTALLWKQLRSRGIAGAPSRSPISLLCCPARRLDKWGTWESKVLLPASNPFWERWNG